MTLTAKRTHSPAFSTPYFQHSNKSSIQLDPKSFNVTSKVLFATEKSVSIREMQSAFVSTSMQVTSSFERILKPSMTTSLQDSYIITPTLQITPLTLITIPLLTSNSVSLTTLTKTFNTGLEKLSFTSNCSINISLCLGDSKVKEIVTSTSPLSISSSVKSNSILTSSKDRHNFNTTTSILRSDSIPKSQINSTSSSITLISSPMSSVKTESSVILSRDRRSQSSSHILLHNISSINQRLITTVQSNMNTSNRTITSVSSIYSELPDSTKLLNQTMVTTHSFSRVITPIKSMSKSQENASSETIIASKVNNETAFQSNSLASSAASSPSILPVMTRFTAIHSSFGSYSVPSMQKKLSTIITSRLRSIQSSLITKNVTLSAIMNSKIDSLSDISTFMLKKTIRSTTLKDLPSSNEATKLFQKSITSKHLVYSSKIANSFIANSSLFFESNIQKTSKVHLFSSTMSRKISIKNSGSSHTNQLNITKSITTLKSLHSSLPPPVESVSTKTINRSLSSFSSRFSSIHTTNQVKMSSQLLSLKSSSSGSKIKTMVTNSTATYSRLLTVGSQSIFQSPHIQTHVRKTLSTVNSSLSIASDHSKISSIFSYSKSMATKVSRTIQSIKSIKQSTSIFSLSSSISKLSMIMKNTSVLQEISSQAPQINLSISSLRYTTSKQHQHTTSLFSASSFKTESIGILLSLSHSSSKVLSSFGSRKGFSIVSSILSLKPTISSQQNSISSHHISSKSKPINVLSSSNFMDSTISTRTIISTLKNISRLFLQSSASVYTTTEESVFSTSTPSQIPTMTKVQNTSISTSMEVSLAVSSLYMVSKRDTKTVSPTISSQISSSLSKSQNSIFTSDRMNTKISAISSSVSISKLASTIDKSTSSIDKTTSSNIMSSLLPGSSTSIRVISSSSSLSRVVASSSKKKLLTSVKDIMSSPSSVIRSSNIISSSQHHSTSIQSNSFTTTSEKSSLLLSSQDSIMPLSTHVSSTQNFNVFSSSLFLKSSSTDTFSITESQTSTISTQAILSSNSNDKCSAVKIISSSSSLQRVSTSINQLVSLSSISGLLSSSVAIIPSNLNDNNKLTMPLRVPTSQDINSSTFRNGIQQNLLQLYITSNQAKRRRRAVSNPEILIESIKRRSDSNETVDVNFFVIQNNSAVAGSDVSKAFAKLSLAQMDSTLGYTVLSKPVPVSSNKNVVTTEKKELALWILVLAIASPIILVLLLCNVVCFMKYRAAKNMKLKPLPDNNNIKEEKPFKQYDIFQAKQKENNIGSVDVKSAWGNVDREKLIDMNGDPMYSIVRRTPSKKQKSRRRSYAVEESEPNATSKMEKLKQQEQLDFENALAGEILMVTRFSKKLQVDPMLNNIGVRFRLKVLPDEKESMQMSRKKLLPPLDVKSIKKTSLNESVFDRTENEEKESNIPEQEEASKDPEKLTEQEKIVMREREMLEKIRNKERMRSREKAKFERKLKKMSSKVDVMDMKADNDMSTPLVPSVKYKKKSTKKKTTRRKIAMNSISPSGDSNMETDNESQSTKLENSRNSYDLNETSATYRPFSSSFNTPNAVSPYPLAPAFPTAATSLYHQSPFTQTYDFFHQSPFNDRTHVAFNSSLNASWNPKNPTDKATFVPMILPNGRCQPRSAVRVVAENELELLEKAQQRARRKMQYVLQKSVSESTNVSMSEC